MVLPVALQLYSVRDDISSDFAGTLKKIKEMGFDGVEFAGFAGKEVQDIKKMLDDVGLKAVSGHVSFDAFVNDSAKVFSDYGSLGCKYVSIPWLDTKIAPGGDDFKSIIPKIRQIGEDAKAAGFTLLYHNHDFEFRKVDGAYGLDILYDSIPAELLAAQIDTCWVKVSGLDPAEYVRKYKGRAPIVHLKDFIMEKDASGNLYELIDNDDSGSGKKGFEFRPLGQGMQDIPKILEACTYAETKWVIVEQDESVTCPPMEAARLSREYLKSLGW